ncbi:MAG TPA: response regulator transcription factor [Solirubrobacteraceae bacterium]|jgi:two-component system OmpR family response regulator|nr:response regulator transcription factor [Solirubrobacteraceae bacterium]
MAAARILLVEDDQELRALLRRGLEEEGFAVSGVRTGAEAMERISAEPPDALIIDVGLPDADGRDLCQALRARGIQSPVLFLTARDAVSDRLAGFGAGGDDYLTKPFSLAELAARLRALLNRAGVNGTVNAAGLILDPTTFEVSMADQSVRLTPTEFRLLGALAAQAERTVSRRELVRVAWPQGAIVHDNTIDVYLARVRRKLRALSGAPGITTVHGVGYRLQ